MKRDQWVAAALDAIEDFWQARFPGDIFTTDDLWWWLNNKGCPTPDDPRWISVIIQALRRHEMIEAAGVTKTKRPERNKGYVTEWRVLVI